MLYSYIVQYISSYEHEQVAAVDNKSWQRWGFEVKKVMVLNAIQVSKLKKKTKKHTQLINK